MIGALLVSGFVAVGLGAVLPAFRRGFAAGLVAQAVGAVAVGVAGFWQLGAGVTVGERFTSAFVPRFGVDGLSGFFLGTLGVVAAPASSSRCAISSRPGAAGSSPR